MPSDKPMLDLKDVAASLNTSVHTARRLCESGKLRAKDMGTGKHHVWRVHPDHLETFMRTPTPIQDQPATPAAWPAGMMKIV